MRPYQAATGITLLLAGCAGQGTEPPRPAPSPEPRAESGIPAGGRSADAYDTTTPDERVAAQARSEGDSDRLLGRTQVSLGDPTEEGLWMRTPLAETRRPGRVEDPESGRSARVELIPTGGGSRLSLSAMRLLEIPLTELPELAVYAR